MAVFGSRDLVERIKEAVDIVELISEVVPLKRAGRRYSGLCPFHSERTPSFFVNPDEQFFYCFGCGAGGDVIKFVMKHRGLDFKEAVKYLADRYNIPINITGNKQDGGDSRKRYLEIIRKAQSFYHEILLYDSRGKEALDYLNSRGIGLDIIKAQKLGYAPSGWDSLLSYFKQNGISIEDGVAVGLFSASSKGSFYDRFRNRVIFPIRNTRGDTVAFGGRSFDGSEPKYLNSPETPIYRKRALLYQYDIAINACKKQGQSGFVYLVEGYMDALAFHRVGEYRVVATLGTAFTDQQARLLKRLADEVVLVYDGDTAGRKAMIRIFPFLLKEKIRSSCVLLPDGMDPDDFLKSKGLDGFNQLVENRMDLIRFVVDEYASLWDGTATGKMHVLSELYSLFRDVNDPILYRECAEIISWKFNVPPDVVIKQFSLWDRQGKRRKASDEASLPVSECVLGGTEEKLIKILVRYPELLARVEDAKDELIENLPESLSSVFRGLYEEWKNSGEGDLDIRRVYDRIDDESGREILARFTMEDDEYSGRDIAGVFLADYIAAFRRKARRIIPRERIKQKLCEAEERGDFDSVKALVNRLRTIGAG